MFWLLVDDRLQGLLGILNAPLTKQAQSIQISTVVCPCQSAEATRRHQKKDKFAHSVVKKSQMGEEKRENRETGS
jgi:hypothetical protein